PIRMAAAKGALPRTPEEQFHVLGALALDPDPAIGAALADLVDGLRDEPLSDLLRAPGVTPQLLHFYAGYALDKPLSMAAIITHKEATDETLDLIAARGPAQAIELIVTNQVRLIRA